MSLDLDMKEIERQAYLFYHEDGLIDIALGTVFLGWSVLLAVAPSGLIGLLGLCAVAIWYLGKRFLTIPRIGIIEPDRKMRNRLNSLVMFLVLLGLATLAAVLLGIFGGGDILADHSLGLVGLLIALAIGVAAHLLHANRLYVYAALLFAAFAGGEAINAAFSDLDTFILSVILAGSLILISGLLVLIRFLRNYPVPAIEA